MDACKHCGSSTFTRCYRANGWWRQLVEIVDGRAHVEETDLDGLRYGAEPKTMRCTDCGRRHPNPSYKMGHD